MTNEHYQDDATESFVPDSFPRLGDLLTERATENPTESTADSNLPDETEDESIELSTDDSQATQLVDIFTEEDSTDVELPPGAQYRVNDLTKLMAETPPTSLTHSDDRPTEALSKAKINQLLDEDRPDITLMNIARVDNKDLGIDKPNIDTGHAVTAPVERIRVEPQVDTSQRVQPQHMREPHRYVSKPALNERYFNAKLNIILGSSAVLAVIVIDRIFG